MRIVITGPPCSGKSTLIEALEKQGYRIVQEVARETFVFLKEHEPEKFNNHPYKQALLETRQLMNWVNNPRAIFDRGLPDEFAYRVFFGETNNKDIFNKCLTYKYDKVFILPFWPEIYESDGVRSETAEEAERLESLLRHAYISTGYIPIEVPKGTVEERMKFLRKELHK